MDDQNLIPQPKIPTSYTSPNSKPQPIISGRPIYITKQPGSPDIPTPPYAATSSEPDIPGSRIYNGQPTQAPARSTDAKSFTVEEQISNEDYGPANDDYEEAVVNNRLKYIIVGIVAVLIISILGFLSHLALGNNRPKGTCAQPEGAMCVIAVTNTTPSYLVYFYTGAKIATVDHIVYLVSTTPGANNSKFWVSSLGSTNLPCNLGNSLQFSFRAHYNDMPVIYNGCYTNNQETYQGEVTKDGKNYSLNLISSSAITKFQALAILETVHIN